MLQEAIDAEVELFVSSQQHRRDEAGRRLVVKNGSLPSREILTGAGPIEVTQGRVRDNSPNPTDRVHFSPTVVKSTLHHAGSAYPRKFGVSGRENGMPETTIDGRDSSSLFVW